MPVVQLGGGQGGRSHKTEVQGQPQQHGEILSQKTIKTTPPKKAKDL